MSGLLHLISLAQTAASAKSISRTMCWLLLVIVVGTLWIAESTWARGIAFLGVDIAICLGIMMFLKSPFAVLQWLIVTFIYAMLSASRIVIKLFVMSLAVILSAIYFISPIDFIPDILLGLGWIDDALIAFGLVSYAAKSQYSLPLPSMSMEEAAEHPVWRTALIATVATGVTCLARITTG